MIKVEFWFHVDTLIDVKKVATAYFCEVLGMRSVNACNVYVCTGNETDISLLNNKFKLLNNQFEDFKEYGGYTLIES